MDAARTARRLGADDTLIVYRRTRAQMPAHEEEAEDAEREGIRINWLRTITAFDGPTLTVEAMELDEDGFPRPTGRFEELAADTVILALGQEADTSFLRALPGVEFSTDGTVVVSSSMMTGCPGVFAGGDMVPAERTVTVGVGHGKKAARHIDAWLRDVTTSSGPKHQEAAFDLLHLWYFGDAARRRQPELAPGRASGRLHRGGRRPFGRRGKLRGSAVPVVRELLRVRRLPRGVPGGRGDQARRRAPLPVRLRPLYGLWDMLRAVPRARHRDGPGGRLMRATLDGNEAAASVAYRLNEVCCIYPITPASPMAELSDEWASKEQTERLGQRAGGDRDAERGRGGRRPARRPAGRGADDDLHRVPGPPAHDPEHVQDRR